MNNNLPNKGEVEFIHHYNLSEYGFDFGDTESSDYNKDILEKITKDFSERYNIAPQIVKDAFALEFLSLRSTEDILILYNNNGNDDVYRIYSNMDTDTFKMFF